MEANNGLSMDTNTQSIYQNLKTKLKWSPQSNHTPVTSVMMRDASSALVISGSDAPKILL